jgi:hypothetical protein
MTEPLDLEAIEAAYTSWCNYELAEPGVVTWIPPLLAEVRRLETELSKMTQAHNAVFNDWETASGEAARATQVERQRWLDAADRVLASFYAFYMNPRDRDIAREVWTNIRKQVGA